MKEVVISSKNLNKVYKLYNRPSDRLKESLNIFHKNYHREHYALKDISFDIYKGETVGIIGTNGAGKSTLLKIITGVLTPTSGELSIKGRISALLELGAGFNMDYTGIENIYLNGTMLGYSEKEIDKKLKDILDFADIGDFVYQPVRTYSSGMFVRLAFASAINIDPEILIVDEALSVGDVFFQAKCYNKFEEFKKMGKTILLVTHSMSTVMRYCDRVILLDKGRKLSEGSPAEMTDLYKKVLVGSDGSYEEKNEVIEQGGGSGLWKESLSLNDVQNSYGNGMAEIIDFGIFDSKKRLTNTVEKGDYFTIKMKVRFKDEVKEPIFAFTVVNLQGLEIAGTNTMYEKANVAPQKQGDVVTVSFRQRMDIQGGDYLLSLGCTGYADGEFTVYHRLYEVCGLNVVSEKNTTGFYDMNSKVEIRQGVTVCH